MNVAVLEGGRWPELRFTAADGGLAFDAPPGRAADWRALSDRLLGKDASLPDKDGACVRTFRKHYSFVMVVADGGGATVIDANEVRHYFAAAAIAPAFARAAELAASFCPPKVNGRMCAFR